MAELERRLSSLKDEFSELEDGFERYSYLMELGSYLPPYPEEKRTPDHLVRGCQSQVWIHCYTKDGHFFFDADSDTFIIKGVLLLLQDLLSDLPVQETANANLELLQELGLISAPLPFLLDPTLARIVVVVVNMWIGIPYTMMTFSGVLMNIPAELYESAEMDGAGPVRRFISITLPYMFFVTAPATITTFVTNFNNFNVIYLLTAGGPFSLDYYQAGKTDLLVTWLYKLTVNRNDYSLASTIGIFIFMLVGSCSLLVYNRTGAVKKEDQFQ